MPLPVIRYALDSTGLSPDNYINGETHTLAAGTTRAVAPTYGAYFTESLKVYDATTNVLLLRNTQYYCMELLQTATELYAKEICYLIVIIDPLVSPNIRINVQVLGGPYTRSADAIISIYNLILNASSIGSINWPDLISKPSQFEPSPHLHSLGDLYGFEYLVTAIERLRNAILLSDAPVNQSILAYFTQKLSDATDSFNAAINQINVSNGVAVGSITLFEGSLSGLSSKYHLCDGSNGTTDLTSAPTPGPGMHWIKRILP